MRDVPVPRSVSPQAQAIIAQGALNPTAAYPPPDDVGAWHDLVTSSASTIINMFGDRADGLPVDVEELDVHGVRVLFASEQGNTSNRVCLDIHGGAFFTGGGDVLSLMCRRVPLQRGMPVWAVDYRMPPDHPYPAPLDDCLTVYRELLTRFAPEQIVVSGGSAGGNLAAAMLLRARDEGLPLPAAAVLITPEADLTESGDSFHTNLGLDNVLSGSLMSANLLYADGHDLTHSYLSPLFADFSAGFPPTFLWTGTRDLFLSNTVLLHRALRRAGIFADLHVTEAASHGGFLGAAPEDDEIDEEIRRFIAIHCP